MYRNHLSYLSDPISNKPFETLTECPNCGTFSEHDFCCDDCESEWADKKKDNDGDYDSERDKELENN